MLPKQNYFLLVLKIIFLFLGDPTLYPCPLGKYCPNGKDTMDCPLLTYRDQLSGKSKSDCFVCPAGYWCNTTGMPTYTNSMCPIGKYCSAGDIPMWCPAGRMRLTPGARSTADCALCTPGYFCPYGTLNYTGIPCREKTYCPEGSAVERDCLAGNYCPEMSSSLTICPGENI